MLKTYINQLKELGIKNPKQAKEKIDNLKKTNKELETKLNNLIKTMETKLEDVDNDFI
jgi:predicted transcriptional regulator